METTASQVIRWPNEPDRVNQWLAEICVYNIAGNLLEWYSPENQLVEQESILQRFTYDSDGRLVEIRGFGEEGSAENVAKYHYDEKGHLFRRVHSNATDAGRRESLYDHKGNTVRFDAYDADGSLCLVRKWTYTYIETANQLDTRFHIEEGSSAALRRDGRERRSVTTFDGAGNKTKAERYFNDWVEQADTFNVSGQLIESRLYRNRKTIAWQTSCFYDEIGNLVESIFKEGRDIKISRFEYDGWNNLTKSSSYENGNPKREDLFCYEYDDRRNWIKQIESVANDNGFHSTTEYSRIMEYYE